MDGRARRKAARLEGGPIQQASPGHGWPGLREMAGVGREQSASCAGNPGFVPACDAKCDAIPADRVDLLARAVLLVAGMAIPEAAREAVLQRVIEELEES